MKNLQRMRREGADVDPKNREHVEAYLIARRTLNRPRADQVLSIIDTATESLEKGCSISKRFYMAHENCFPDGVPGSLCEHIVDTDELLERYECKDADLTNMVLFHTTAEKRALPKWTHDVTFYQKSKNTKKHKGAKREAADTAHAPETTEEPGRASTAAPAPEKKAQSGGASPAAQAPDPDEQAGVTMTCRSRVEFLESLSRTLSTDIALTGQSRR